MSDIEYRPSDATLIDPVPVKVGRVSIDEVSGWNGWAYDNADDCDLDPIAIFSTKELALAFDAFRRSEHCPEDFRTNMDSAVVPCHVPQIVWANHMDDEEAVAVLVNLCGGGCAAWIGETSDEAAGE